MTRYATRTWAAIEALTSRWEQSLLAIWRAAAVNQAPRFSDRKCTSRYTTASQLIASKLGSHKMIPVVLAIVENKSAHLPSRDIKPL
jgi:hypothetical protein